MQTFQQNLEVLQNPSQNPTLRFFFKFIFKTDTPKDLRELGITIVTATAPLFTAPVSTQNIYIYLPSIYNKYSLNTYSYLSFYLHHFKKIEHIFKWDVEYIEKGSVVKFNEFTES